MVLFAEPYEEDVVGLLEWGKHAKFVNLYNRFWLSSSVTLKFNPKKPSEEEGLYMDVDMWFATLAARIMQYLYYSDLPEPYSLKINDEYYVYVSWCGQSIYLPSGESLDNICESVDGYSHNNLNKLSLKPPPSLHTVVPTQLSSLI